MNTTSGMSELRELSADDLNAVTGGCRTVDPRWYVDSIRAPAGGAFADNSTANPSPLVPTKLMLYAPLA